LTRHPASIVSLIALAATVAFVAAAPLAPAPRAQGAAAADVAPERLADGVRLAFPDGFLRLQVKTDAVIRVLFSNVRDPRVDTMVVVGPGGGPARAALNPFGERGRTPGAAVPAPRWDLKTSASTVTLSTAKISADVDRATGRVTFRDAVGRVILAEAPGGRTMTPATVQGESTYHVQQRWLANDDESLYGLGQRQEGKLDVKGYDFDLWQRNTVVAFPVIVSSRGYGILWDNTSPSKFGDTRPFVPIPTDALVDANGQRGALSRGTFATAGADRLQNPVRVTTIEPATANGRSGGGAPDGTPGWQGEIVAPTTGDFQFQTYSNGGIQVWLDGQLQIDHWKQSWAAENDQFKVHLEAGRHYPIRIVTDDATTLRVAWKTPAPDTDTSFWSEVGEAVDYDFIYGPDLDDVVAGYRALTGEASMLPRWAFGYWQSKNKYETQAEVLDTLAEFRRRGIPIDNIVQDWQYWPADAWGDHEFEASRYPDPDAMIRTIHDEHAHFMISVWGKFYPETKNFKALEAIDGLYLTTYREHTLDWLQHNYVFYDVFNAPARKLFWDQVNRALFSKGVDAWWMDATEPDLVQPSPPTLETLRHDIDRTAIGTASRVMNAYPLMNSEAVYDGQRSTAPDQRVFILTRSGFPGIQRYGTVTWSGDITSTWATLRKQITAGLGFSIAGDPYWTNDTGGYTMDQRFARASGGEALDEWRELNARWFQFSTFSPILRVHGADRPREPWNIGDESTPVYQAELASDRLRYALLPYIYSLAGAVAHDGGTMMRPLVMDFRDDRAARDVTDEYMFGPAFLASPGTEYKARSRRVYLPAGPTWYDFWTGASSRGGQTVTADAPYDRMPVFVRAGSIVPIGPAQQYVGEKPGDALTLYVYAGANGRFSLYEDDGVSYGYERGELSRIPMTWDDASGRLTIERREGTFPGMVTDRTFTVVVVSARNAMGYQGADAAGQAVSYSGEPVSVTIGGR
jgi:alpha-D-xyloside xylohydrolase